MSFRLFSVGVSPAHDNTEVDSASELLNHSLTIWYEAFKRQI